jgi:hypothetical protein
VSRREAVSGGDSAVLTSLIAAVNLVLVSCSNHGCEEPLRPRRPEAQDTALSRR